jgi:hypothetical protein
MTLLELINQWKLNKELLASKIEMPVGTFKNKLSENQPKYSFTEAEENKLLEVLKDLGQDIEIVAGMSFNKALSTIVKKKI